jgi:hypothetical protein
MQGGSHLNTALVRLGYFCIEQNLSSK